MNSFIIYALPRSRTAWLAHFLSYEPWSVTHENSIFMRSVADIAAFFCRPRVGSVEPNAAPGYQLVRHYAPGTKEIVIRRPVEDVIEASLALEMGEFQYNEGLLRRVIEYEDRLLDRIAPKASLVMDYSMLDTEAGCQRLFEHCLDLPFDRDWWHKWDTINVQVDMPKFLRYCYTHQAEIANFKRLCKSDLWRLARAGLVG